LMRCRVKPTDEQAALGGTHEVSTHDFVFRFLRGRNLDVNDAAPNMEVIDGWLDVIPGFIRGGLKS
jgi:hypothetical protein